MPIWICETCKIEFNRVRSGARPIRFCSQPCYRAWYREAKPTGGQFNSSRPAWNKGMKGIHLSPHSEFKKGRISETKVTVGSVALRLRLREGYQRAFVKIAEPNKWRERAKVVWEEANGPLVYGCVIHHIDHNPINDAIENLQMLTKSEHMREHRGELLEARRRARLARLAAE